MCNDNWGYADMGIGFINSGQYQQPKYPHSQGLTVVGIGLAIIVLGYVALRIIFA